jgi:hypothetical protein
MTPPGRLRNFGFWRVTVDGNHAPERIETGGDPGATPAAARSRDRLAFTRISLDDDIYRFEAGGRFQLVTGSTVSDTDPRIIT